MKVVNNLKAIFQVKSKYFYKKDMLSRYLKADNIPVMNIAYRSKIMNVISKHNQKLSMSSFWIVLLTT